MMRRVYGAKLTVLLMVSVALFVTRMFCARLRWKVQFWLVETTF
jgi:hypothetical protein